MNNTIARSAVFALSLVCATSLADPVAVACATPNAQQKNIALGKRVTSNASEAAAHKRAANRLTDGNAKTDAYPGRFSLDYTVDLKTFAEGGPDDAAPSFDIRALTIHRGKYGRLFSGVKAKGGGWTPAGYRADYVNQYSLEYLSRTSDDWIEFHACSGRPTDEDARGVVVVRTPDSASASGGDVVTRIEGLELRDVNAIRIRAKGAHWIGVYECEVWGQSAI